jgi:hypothetical protein
MRGAFGSAIGAEIVSGRAWRRLAILLGVLALVFGWRACFRGDRGRTDRTARGGSSGADDEGGGARSGSSSSARSPSSGGAPGGGDGDTGIEEWDPSGEVAPPLPEPHWLVKFFSPKPDETILDYRDRVLPVVQAVVEPQRIRVAENWRDFAEQAQLTGAQKAELNAAVDQAVESLMDQTFQAVLSGEILPPNLKPSTGVTFARDLLDTVDRANQRFRAVLRPDQLELYDRSRFDVADYLLFATRWEELLGVTK